MYENFKEFLQNKIGEQGLKLEKRTALDVQGVLDWWKPKAIKRYQDLFRDNRLKPENLFYHKIKRTDTESISYDQAKIL